MGDTTGVASLPSRSAPGVAVEAGGVGGDPDVRVELEGETSDRHSDQVDVVGAAPRDVVGYGDTPVGTPADPALWSMDQLLKFCRMIAPTDFVPKNLRGNPPAVLACVMTGRECGLGLMESIRHIRVIDGEPSLSPQIMHAAIVRAGHQIVIHHTDDACTATGTRADNGEVLEVRWTLDDARRAGLAGKNNWKTYPRAMLRSRAISELARSHFPDVLGPVRYTPEELEP